MDPNNEKQPETPDDITAGMMEAVGAVDDEAVVQEGQPEGEDVPAGDPPPEGGKPDEPALDADGKPVETKPEEGKGTADLKDGKQPEGDKPAEPEKDAEIEKEIADRKLEGKSADRFRELAAEVKTLAPIKEALDKAGIKDVAELPKLMERAQIAQEFASEVQATGSSPEQYGQALDYLTLVNRAKGGDVKAAEQAYSVMEQEMAALGAFLGKDVPGATLPEDLQAEVTAGDLTRARALEIAAGRTREAQAGQRQQQQTEQQKAAQAQTEGNTALNGWDQQMSATDAGYAAKRPALSKMVAFIKANVPPDKWLEATKMAYATIPAPAAPPPAAKPPVGSVPLRPTGMRQTLERAEFDDPVEAMMAGIKAASG